MTYGLYTLRLKDRDSLCVSSNRRLCEVGSVILVCRGSCQFVIDGSNLVDDLFCEFLPHVLIGLERLNSIQQSEWVRNDSLKRYET
jgi:hypothetical protein